MTLRAAGEWFLEMQWVLEVAGGIVVVAAVIGLIALVVYVIWRQFKKQSIGELLRRHFGRIPIAGVAVNERQFP